MDIQYIDKLGNLMSEPKAKPVKQPIEAIPTKIDIHALNPRVNELIKSQRKPRSKPIKINMPIDEAPFGTLEDYLAAVQSS